MLERQGNRSWQAKTRFEKGRASPAKKKAEFDASIEFVKITDYSLTVRSADAGAQGMIFRVVAACERKFRL